MKSGTIVWVWTLVVIIATGLLTYASLTPRTYHGTQAEFSIEEDWYLDVVSTGTVHIQAADSSYFRLVQGDTHLYGVPMTPPLDYDYEEYFHLEGQLQNGRWEVTEGNGVSVQLAGETAFTVTQSPTGSAIAWYIFIAVFLSAIVWFLGILIGAVTAPG
jgi:hypothetical protein